MTRPVEVVELSKWFGQKVAVSEVSVGFDPGVTGILGPNGAGKTTLLRLITGLQVPSQGTVRLLGVDPRRDPGVYSKVSLVPEDEAIYPTLTCRDFVELNASLAGRTNRSAVDDVLEQVGLTADAGRQLGEFSKGMRQRAKVAGALVSDPEVIVLDEPLNGADPVQRAHLIEVFVALGRAGKTVIVSSHVLAEVERMAEQLVAMVDGRLAAEGTVGSLRAAMTDRPRIVRISSDKPRELAARLIHLDGIESVSITPDGLEVSTVDAPALAVRLPADAVAVGARLSRVAPSDESLESVFRYLVGSR
ncbi:MAG TPA: ABC transporter ATP-binding protein [Acidimicrobiia bacterium]|jgi:ABC-2 type transport system ATP-binding protein